MQGVLLCAGIHPAVHFQVGDEKLNAPSVFISFGFAVTMCGAQNFILRDQNIELKHSITQLQNW